MTRHELEKQARDYLLRAGWFQGAPANKVVTFCPRRPCSARVETTLPYGKRGAAAATRALTSALADHWEDQHGAAPAV